MFKLSRSGSLFLWLFLSVFVFNAKSQSIEKYIKTGKFTVASELEVYENYIYLVKDQIPTYYGLVGKRPSIYKLDMQLNVVDSFNIISALPQNVEIGAVYGNTLDFDNNGNLWLGFGIRNYQQQGKSMVLKIDTSFQTPDTIPMNKYSDTSQFSIAALTVDGEDVYVSGSRFYNSKNESDFYLAKLNNDTIIKTTTVPLSLFTPPISTFAYGTSIVLNKKNVLVSTYPTFKQQVAIFDSTLQLQRLDDMRDDSLLVGGWSQLLSMPNGPPKVATISARDIDDTLPWNLPPSVDWRYKNISLISMDSNYHFTRVDTFQYIKNRIYDTVFNYSVKMSMGSFDGNVARDSVVMMATNMDVLATYSLKPQTITYINNGNAHTGQLHWFKTFSNGYAHQARRVVSLPGNRWLLVFDEYNWDKYPGDNLAIHMILLDANGNPLGITEDEEKALTQKPLVYPNPASDKIYIDNLHWPGNEFNYTLTNMSGQVVQKGKVVQGEAIQTTPMLQGNFIINISNTTGFGWASKIVIR